MQKNNVIQILSKYIISSLYIEVYTFYGIWGITCGTLLVLTKIHAKITIIVVENREPFIVLLFVNVNKAHYPYWDLNLYQTALVSTRVGTKI